jgi:hypothetical protein
MRRFIRDNSLSLVLLAVFIVTLLGQSITGFEVYNDDQRNHNQPTITFSTYFTTGHFVEAVFENWESEFLQDAAYVVLTVYLYQRGSSESKDPDKEEPVDADPRDSQTDPNVPWPVRQGGGWLRFYENSLLLTFLACLSLLLPFMLRAGRQNTSMSNCSTVVRPSRPSNTLVQHSFGSSRSRIGRANFWRYFPLLCCQLS